MLIRVGVLGLGRMGKLHFLNALRMKDASVVAVADKDTANQKVAEKYHVKAFDDYKKLIDHEDLDVVIISLPNFLRKESIFHVSEKGLDIFVDKPLARNLAEAREIIRKVRSENIRLMVGVNYRYFDSVQKLKEVLDEGRIGDVAIATSELIMGGPFSHPLVPRRVPEWWLDKERAGGGVLLDLGYHLVDLFDWMFGDLEVLYSNLGHRFNLALEDSATVVLRSKKASTRCVINVGWFSKMIFPHFNFRINLHGTVGYACTDQFSPKNPYLHAIREGVLNSLRKVTGRKIHLLSYTYYYSSFAKALEVFFESIRKGSAIPVSLEGQLNTIKIIEDVRHQGGSSHG